ncbi:hypothetical protein L6R52_31690 [Myxococcota bacterium]|nr:hypothetical protein [Myxococcota bacterium]
MSTRIFVLCSALLVGVAACGGDTPAGGSGDASTPVDTGTPGGDATVVDTGVAPDGTVVVDTGVPDDGGVDVDTGVPPNDGGPAPDAAANPNNPQNPALDTDCDGLSDAEEFSAVYPNGSKTDPNDADSDDDGISDGVELGRTTAVPGSNCPGFVGDADATSRPSPVSRDTDGDGIADGAEDRNANGRVDAGEMNPSTTDSDGDMIPDAVEDRNQNGTREQGELDPTSRDSDGDGISDGLEDPNRNGSVELGETNPLLADTDGDGAADGDEDTNGNGVREPYETDPRTSDTDCDGLSDGAELAAGSSPLVADSDGDGISDGVEGRVTGPVAGSNCPGLVVDADPAAGTIVADFDSDDDGVPDGVEDANQNGRVDPGETDPNDDDSDGDGVSDGDELFSGFDPLNPNDPAPNVGGGVNAVCATNNLKVVNFNVGGSDRWTLSTEQTTAYAPITVSAAGVGVDVAALDDAVAPVAGFVARMPVIAGGPATAAGQTTAVNARISAGAAAESLSVTVRTSARNITSHDGYETAVSGIVDVNVTAGTRSAAEVRNALVRLATGLGAGDFVGLPTNTPGANSNQFTYTYQVLVRSNPQDVIVVLALIDRARFDNAADNGAVLLADLTNGTALARANAGRDKDCDPFVTGTQAIADFVWMADISGSTDDDRGRIVAAANVVFNALQTNGVDFRMAVVPHQENSITQGAGNGGDLRGVGFTRNANLFASYLQDTSGTDGCEFGIDAASAAVTKALPRSAAGVEDARKFRDGAQVAVVYISDEYAQEITEGQCGWNPGGAACDTGVGDVYSSGNQNTCTVVPNAAQQACINSIVQPYVTQLRNESAIAFGQVISPSAVPGVCTSYACPQPGSQPENEPGLGYTDVVTATGGTFYSPCVDNPGNALQSIIDAVSGAASQFQLTGAPISSTIKVGVVRIGTGGNGATDIVPRDRDNGFDYDPVSNAIFFRGTTYRPNRNDLVVISYRLWLPPEEPCGGPCAPGLVCDPQLGVCTCDQSACAANCGPGQVCDSACQCTCAADCGGLCGPGQVCNSATCSCECAPNCGGSCPTGTVCNPNTCGCECDSSCGGACAGTPLQCDTGSCSCQCPSDCGGQCAPGATCNTSTCSCSCDPACDAGCPGNAACDPANGCACVCPADCGGCPDNTVCDPGSCACTCPADCTVTRGCVNRQVCDPNNGCGCACPEDCGGCNANETCDSVNCRCVPIV